MDKDDDEDIGEKLHRAHEQLDAADRELAEITDLIDEVVERELEEAGVRTITNLHDGSVTIQLPTDRIASRLNRHVSGRYYVTITKMDDLEVRTYEEIDYDIQSLGEIKPGDAVMATVTAMQRDYADAPGAPIGHLYTHLLRHGYSEREVARAIESLRDVGELYSPDQEHLRTA